MQLLKLTEEQLKNIATPLILQRSENYVGKFTDCKIEGSVLSGKIKGNHGVYEVELKIDSDPIGYKCGCDTSHTMFCKHAAALGLTYVYTPWVFALDAKIDRNEIKDIEELQFYLKSVKLKDLVEELRKCCIGISKLSEITGISSQQVSAIIKDELSGKHHVLTDPLKLSCMYFMERSIKING